MAGYIGAKQGVTQVDGYNRSEADAEFVDVTGDTMTGAMAINGDLTVDTDTLYVDSTNNRVGIGTTSPDGQLHLYTDAVVSPAADADDFIIEKTGDTGLSILSTTTGRIYFGDAGSNDQGSIRYVHSDDSMRFEANSTEACRIDSSGNLLVGKTTTTSDPDTGMVLQADGVFKSTSDGTRAGDFNRGTSDGEIIRFSKDGSTVGSIASRGGSVLSVIFDPRSNGVALSGGSAKIKPADETGNDIDNTVDLGSPSYRFDDVYATNGTIQTSDRNEKQDIEALSDAEQRVAVAAKGLLRKYRWKDKVAEKGDAARIHFGIIAQDLQAAFEAEGLDAGRYGMFISSTWWEAEVERTREVEQEDGTTVTETYTATETYDEPTEGATERTRLGVRYPELLAFIIAAL